MSRIKTNQSGFSTVELLVTIVTIGIIFGAFITTFTTIQNINKKSLDIQKSNTLAFEKLQGYENQQFENLPSSSSPETWEEIEDFSDEIPNTVQQPRIGKAYINSNSPTLKQVGIQIEFGDGGSKQTITYVSYIQANGVGR